MFARYMLAAALLPFTMPALAFDDLKAMTPLFPPIAESVTVFDYNAPLRGFAPGSPTLYGPFDADIALALRSAQGVDPVTGIDFTKVTGVLETGAPPYNLVVLFGSPDFTAGVGDAMAARHFTTSAFLGVPVLVRGADYNLDFSKRAEGDALGHGMGQAQRIALGDGYLLRTAGWPSMRLGLTNLAAPPADAVLWTAMIDAVQNSAGDAAHLDIASGWTAAAFFDPGLDAILSTDPSTLGKSKIKLPTQAVSLVFPCVLFALTQNQTSAALHIAMPFGDAATAMAGGGEWAAALQDRLDLPATPKVRIAAADDYSVAVVSIELPVAEASAARDLYGRLTIDINRRDFGL